MTKAEIVAQISRQSGIEKTVVMTVIESFMENVKESMVVRIISIHDKIDTDNKLFPDTTPAEVLAMFGALPEEVAVLRKSSDKIIRLQQSISIPISKKSMSKTERDKKIVDMYNNGYSIRDIWKESGVQSKSTVYSILNKYKVQLNRTPGRVPGIRK